MEGPKQGQQDEHEDGEQEKLVVYHAARREVVGVVGVVGSGGGGVCG